MLCPHPSLSHLPQIPSPFHDFFESLWHDAEITGTPPPEIRCLVEWDCEPLLFTVRTHGGKVLVVNAVESGENHTTTIAPDLRMIYIAAKVPDGWGRDRVFTRAIFERADIVYVVGYFAGGDVKVSPLHVWQTTGAGVPAEWLPDADAFINADFTLTSTPVPPMRLPSWDSLNNGPSLEAILDGSVVGSCSACGDTGENPVSGVLCSCPAGRAPSA